MNIELDFSTIVCDLGHTNDYTNKKCEICSEDFGDIAPKFDPKVEARRQALKVIYTTFESKKKHRKEWHSKFKKGEVIKKEVLNPMDVMQSVISQLDIELQKKSLKDIDLSSDNLGKDNIQSQIIEFARFIEKTYELLLEIEQLDFKMLYKNMSKRLASAIRLFISGYKDFLDVATSLNYPNALKLQTEGQTKIDAATNELDILSKIIENMSISLNYDLFENGQVNQGPLLAMLFSGGESTSLETIKKTSDLTYFYFADLLENNFEEMEKSNLISLSVYRYMGTSSFDDTEYLSKIKTVLKVMNDAYEKDPERFKSFFKLYLDKFIYMQKKVNEFSTNYAFVIGNRPTDEILMQNSIKWYKDLSEGIYREASRLIYFSLKLITNKEISDDEILNWIGFSTFFDEFKQQKKRNLHKITEGVEKLIRNSEAHVDYDINHIDNKVILRNIDSHNRICKTKEYTFDEFFEITNKLLETIFSMICGMQILVFNKANEFKSEIIRIEENENEISKVNNTTLVFALTGVILVEAKKGTSQNELILEGKLSKEIDLNILGDKIFYSCVHICSYESELNSIDFSLLDKNNKLIGKVNLKTNYIQMFHEDQSPFKDYYLILAQLTAEIDEIFTNNIIKSSDLLFIKILFQKMLEQQARINNYFENKFRIKSFEMVVNSAIEEVELLERLTYLYKEHKINFKVIDYSKFFLENYKKLLRNIKRSGKISISIKEDLSEINKSFEEYMKVINNEITLETYLDNYIKNFYSQKVKIGLNELCPCGSNKKYKKCCRV